MFRKYTLFVILSLLVHISYSQNKNLRNKNLKIEYINSREVSNVLNLNFSSTAIFSKTIQKYQVKCKIKANDREDIDLNKFYLLDHKNKIRYRPLDISYSTLTGYFPFPKLLKEKLDLGGYFRYQHGINYKPQVSDSFQNFQLENYKDVSIPMQFGTKNNPKSSVIYFDESPLRKFKVKLYFPIIVDVKNPDLELFYGKENITNIKI